jgi:hypothetical protein
MNILTSGSIATRLFLVASRFPGKTWDHEELWKQLLLTYDTYAARPRRTSFDSQLSNAYAGTEEWAGFKRVGRQRNYRYVSTKTTAVASLPSSLLS